MFSQRTFDSFNSFVILVNNSEQRSVVREFIRASYIFFKLLVRLLTLVCIFLFYLGADLLVTCYKLALDLYLKLVGHLRAKFQSIDALETEKIDYFPDSSDTTLPQERSPNSDLEPELIWLDVDGEPHELWFDPEHDSKWWCDGDTTCVPNDADRDRPTVANLSKSTVREELDQLRLLDL